MQLNNFEEWYSNETKLDNQMAISVFEEEHNIRFPKDYIDLVRFRDGGTLEKDLFFYYDERLIRNCIGYFLCWQKETLPHYYSYLPNIYNDPPEFFPKGLIPFAPDGGGNYVCFDYRNCKETPSIVFWHHAVEENEGIFVLADSFEKFINSLKSEEECN